MKTFIFSFSLGDAIKFKTGGPDMMIQAQNFYLTELTGIAHYNVSWFDTTANDILEKRGIAEHLLVKCSS